MKKTLIALVALAGVAAAGTITEDCIINKDGDLFAGAFDFTFTLDEAFAVTGDSDLLLAYYQVNNGRDHSVNAFKLSSKGVLTLDRGKSLTLSSDALTSDSTLGTTHDYSTFKVVGGTEAYTLTTPGTYTVQYLGGKNGEAAANLLLGDVVVASFTGGSHNMNGSEGDNASRQILYVKVNDAYVVPEPTTATLSLLALAGLAARRRRR